MTEPDFTRIERGHPSHTGYSGYWKHPDAHIARSAEIGPGCYIGPNVTIAAEVVIGPNTVIGDRGFGYTTERGEHEYREHPHGVTIGRRTRIGANTCIDAGRWRTTEISSGVVIDNLCHIAHNVRIGHAAMIIARSMIGGSCDIGISAKISSATICDHITIGTGAHVGLGAVVMDDVGDGEVWVGVPARRIR